MSRQEQPDHGGGAVDNVPHRLGRQHRSEQVAV